MNWKKITNDTGPHCRLEATTAGLRLHVYDHADGSRIHWAVWSIGQQTYIGRGEAEDIEQAKRMAVEVAEGEHPNG